MKLILRSLQIFVFLFVFVCRMSAQVAIPGGTGPTADEQKTKWKEDCNKFLDRWIGNWMADHSLNNEPVKSEVSFERAVQNMFLVGHWVTKDKSGKIIFEASMVLTYNYGVIKYLMYTFESTGWSRQFIGDPDAQQLMLQGMTPQGMEYYRWKFNDAGDLERAYWKPSNAAKAEGDPAEVLVFKRVKTTKG
jgi:hypothetical protein